MKYVRVTVVWLVTVLMAVVMTGSGVEKFTKHAWERMFRVWGYPDHFFQVIGAIEVLCGVGLLVPRIAAYCASTLSVVMIGAAITQITRGGRNGVGELVFAVLLAAVAYVRRPAFLRQRSAGAPEHRPPVAV
jgi:putative oxidoreductase